MFKNLGTILQVSATPTLWYFRLHSHYREIQTTAQIQMFCSYEIYIEFFFLLYLLRYIWFFQIRPQSFSDVHLHFERSCCISSDLYIIKVRVYLLIHKLILSIPTSCNHVKGVGQIWCHAGTAGWPSGLWTGCGPALAMVALFSRWYTPSGLVVVWFIWCCPMH